MSADLSGKVGIDFTGIDDTLIYASASKGFKSGGFQGQLTFSPPALGGFEEENLYAYEIGFKSRFLDRRVQLNGAAFLYDFEDLQFYGPLFDSPFGPLFGIDNAGNAEVKGAELEQVWLVAAGLDIHVGLGLLDTELTSSFLPGVAGGQRIAQLPRYQLQHQAQLRLAFWERFERWPVSRGRLQGRREL